MQLFAAICSSLQLSAALRSAPPQHCISVYHFQLGWAEGPGTEGEGEGLLDNAPTYKKFVKVFAEMQSGSQSVTLPPSLSELSGN